MQYNINAIKINPFRNKYYFKIYATKYSTLKEKNSHTLDPELRHNSVSPT